MHSLSIHFKEGSNQEELWHKFYQVCGSLRENGQTNGREMSAFIKENSISITLLTFTEEALDQKYFSKYVNESISALEELCANKLKIKYLGHVEDEPSSACGCKNHAYFVLYHHGNFSPISCGSCQKFVPLFKLPKLFDTRVWDILAWENTYKAIKILDLNCGTGERWAIKQQCDFDSGLSKQGLDLAKKITEASGILTYYFLANFKKIPKQKDINRPCPSCGGGWHLEKEIFGYFRYKCDKCLLMSSYSAYHY
jgi:predicted  nucleic acid-binding Zn ribbon protein